MITLTTTQQTIVDSNVKSHSWLFEVTDNLLNDYFWSTKAYTFDAQAYTFKVIPKTFKAVTINRARTETGMANAVATSFSITNKGNSLSPANFVGGEVLLKLVISDGTDEEIIRQWRLSIKDCQGQYQEMSITCEDFIREFLKGDYPNTEKVRDIFPSNDISADDLCVPVPFGTCYIPLKSAYVPAAASFEANTVSAVASTNNGYCSILDSAGNFEFERGRFVTIVGFVNPENNGTFKTLWTAAGSLTFSAAAGFVAEAAGATITVTQGARYYILGDTLSTYSVAEVRSPRIWGKKSSWLSSSFDFNQSVIVDIESGNWKGLQAIIADDNKDGVAESPGLWRQGEQFLDMPTKFTKSNTATMTSPADIVAFVLEDMGIDSGAIDTGVGSSFETADTEYTTWTLEFNGAFWKKESRSKILFSLLLQCNSSLRITDKIELKVLDKIVKKTYSKTDILIDSFKNSRIISDELADSAYVFWQEAGEAQDEFLTMLVGVDGSNDYISDESIEIPFIQDSQDVQRSAILHYERKFLKKSKIDFEAKGTSLAMEPDDMITIDHADYGGTFNAVIDRMVVNADLSISFSGTVY